MTIPHTTTALLLLIALALVAVRRRDATLLVDAAFVALYARYPMPATLALVPIQAVVRRIPTLARECAVLLRVDEPAGWTLHALLFVLPGLRAYAVPDRLPAIGVTTALPSLPQAPPLDTTAWLRLVNTDETAPHLGVIGPTRAGKTTLALAVLGQRPGQLVIVTPKSEETDPWGGAGAVRIAFTADAADFSPLADAVRQVHREMLRRNAERTIGQDQPLTLVIDEYALLVGERPEVRNFVLQLWTMGASAKVRVVVIDPEISVKAWGIEGRGEARQNLVFIRVAPDRSAELFRIDGQARPVAPRRIDTRQIPQLATHATLVGRVWSGLSVPVCASESQQTAPQQTQIADDRLLAALAARGLSREQARRWLAARGMGLDNNRWAAVAGRSKVPSA